MNRDLLAKQLLRAEAFITRGDRRVARQRRIVARLERDGHDTTEARKVLMEFVLRRGLHIAERDRLSRQLGDN
jgi:hypothetical protein